MTVDAVSVAVGEAGVWRHVRIGGVSRGELLARLQAVGIGLNPAALHRAPPGSITVVSTLLSDDEAVPKGFYLRCIAGVLWLRGYRAPADHVWSPGDVLLFQRPACAD